MMEIIIGHMEWKLYTSDIKLRNINKLMSDVEETKKFQLCMSNKTREIHT